MGLKGLFGILSDTKEYVPQACREMTVVEILKNRRDIMIAELAKLNTAIKHFDGTSHHEQEILMTVFTQGGKTR